MGTHFRSGFWVLVVVACASLCWNGPVVAENRRPKNVQVAIQAKWSGTPLLLEAGYVIFFSLSLSFLFFSGCNKLVVQVNCFS